MTNRAYTMYCKRPSFLDLSVTGLATVALMLHTIGIIFPMWWTVHEEDSAGKALTFHYGIWAIVDCINDECVTTSSIMHGDRAWLIGPAVLIVLADVLLCTVVITTCWYLFHDKHGLFLRRLCAALSAGGAGTILLAVMIFFKKKTGLRPSDAPETSAGNPDWCFFMSTFGAIFAVVHSIACGVSVRRLHKTGSTEKQKQKNTIFGIDIEDLEVDMKALRRGELSFGKNVDFVRNDVSRIPSVNSLP